MLRPFTTFVGTVLAVLDISGPVTAADPLLGIAIQSMAGAFEGILRAREVEVLAARVETLRHQEAEIAALTTSSSPR